MKKVLQDSALYTLHQENYEPPTSSNIRHAYMHLTNYSLNKRSSKFVHTDEITEINEGTKQTVTSCYAQLRTMGYDTNNINEKIDECVAKTLYAALPSVKNQADRYINEHNLKKFKGFHILGFDMLLDDSGNPYLLEVNSSPSLDINYEIEIRPGVTETHLSELDYYVKRSVVEDAINLVFSKRRNTGRYRPVLPKVYDFQDNMRIFDTLFNLYRKLCDRSYSYIPASKFRKLSSLLSISLNDLDIIYSQISRRNDASRLDYNLFITTLEHLSNLIYTDPEMSLVSKIQSLLSRLETFNT